jgi:hypothetical protein
MFDDARQAAPLTRTQEAPPMPSIHETLFLVHDLPPDFAHQAEQDLLPHLARQTVDSLPDYVDTIRDWSLVYSDRLPVVTVTHGIDPKVSVARLGLHLIVANHLHPDTSHHP